MSIQQRGDSFQLRVKHKLLHKPFFYTFPSVAEAETYRDQLKSLLDRGIVPVELLTPDKKETAGDIGLSILIGHFLRDGSPAPTDEPNLQQLRSLVGDTRLSQVTFQWAHDFIRKLKVERNIAPSTIRKKIESLARVVDWHLASKTMPGGQTLANPLKLLPRGYSAYSAQDKKAVEAVGKKAKVDNKRKYRVPPEHQALINKALDGWKREDSERPYPASAELKLFVRLIIETGLRMSEAFKLRKSQIQKTTKVIDVEGSKGHRGVIKPRFVPISPSLCDALLSSNPDGDGRVFSFWDGTLKDVPLCSARLSSRFRALFDYVGLTHLREHDMRHVATCGWVTMRNAQGEFLFSETEICKIMGWEDARMMLHYASLRGDTLSRRLQEAA